MQDVAGQLDARRRQEFRRTVGVSLVLHVAVALGFLVSPSSSSLAPPQGVQVRLVAPPSAGPKPKPAPRPVAKPAPVPAAAASDMRPPMIKGTPTKRPALPGLAGGTNDMMYWLLAGGVIAAVEVNGLIGPGAPSQKMLTTSSMVVILESSSFCSIS